MSHDQINEVKLVNGVGYNLARLITEDGVDFEVYVDLTRKIASAYLGYNHKVTPAKVEKIAQQRFTNQVNDYITRSGLDVGNHLFLSKAYTLYFLGYGGSLDKHIKKIEEIINDLHNDYKTSNKAREDLDALVIANLNSLEDISEAIRSISHDLVGAG